MDDRTQLVVGAALFFAGFGYFVSMKFWRIFARKESPWTSLLQRSAPLVSIAVMLVGLILAATVIHRVQKRNEARDARTVAPVFGLNSSWRARERLPVASLVERNWGRVAIQPAAVDYH